jgi:hypothetical protein
MRVCLFWEIPLLRGEYRPMSFGGKICEEVEKKKECEEKE